MVRPRGRNSVTAPAAAANQHKEGPSQSSFSLEPSVPPAAESDSTRPPGLEDVLASSSGTQYEQYRGPSLYEQHYYRALAHLQSGGLPFDHFRGTVLGGRDGAMTREMEAAACEDVTGSVAISSSEWKSNIQAAELLWEAPETGKV